MGKELNLKEFNAYNNTFDISERKELIAEALVEAREMYGLKQAEVAKYLGIKAGTYSTYENGTREAPAEIIVRLAILYDIPTDVLLERDRFSKETYLAGKQFDIFNEQLDEIKKIATDKDNQLNPEFKDFLNQLTSAFDKVGNALEDFNDKAKKE